MIVDELGRIPMSPNLAAALQRASDYAAAQLHREVTLEHLLLALTQDPDAGQVLEASHVDLSRLEADVSTHLGRIEERFHANEPLQMTVAGELKRILEASAAAASKGRRREINGAIVLAAIVGDGRTIAAHMLRAQGLTFEEAIRVLRAPAAPPRPAAPPGVNGPLPPPAPTAWTESAAQPPILPPRPGPGHAPGARHGNPATEDILASARERVQTRTHPPTARAAEPERHDYEPAFEPMVPAAPARPAPPVMGEPEPDEEFVAEPRYEPPAPEWQPAPPVPVPAVVPPSPPPLPAQMESHWAPPPIPPAPSQVEPTFRPQEGPSVPPQSRSPQLHPPYSPPPLPVSRPAPPPPPGAAMRPPFPPRPMTPGAMPPVPPPMQAAPPPSREQLSPPAYAPWPEPPPEPPRPTPAETTGRPHATPRQAEERRRAPSPASVEAGQLAENVPRKMRVAVPVVVEARIAKASIKAIADGMSGSVHQHEVQVTKAMSVKLRAPDGGFWIETASPETQWIESIAGLMSDDFASWRWSVTPRSSGRKRLQLVVSARTVGADGLTAETALPDQIIDVRVSVNWAQTARRWGGWVAAAILGGLIQRFGEGALADGLKSLIALVTG